MSVLNPFQLRLSDAVYVDPNFTGGSNGSENAPYKTITAAIAGLPSTGGTIFIPPVGITENITFPNSGNWEVACLSIAERPQITGNVAIPTTSSSLGGIYLFTNVTINGNISGDSGNSSSGNILVLTMPRVTGTISLTGASWTLISRTMGPAAVNFGGALSGAVSVAGNIQASRTLFGAGITTGTGASEFFGCRLSSATTSMGGGTWTITDTTFATAPTFTGSGSVIMDAFSYFQAGSLSLASGATLTLASAIDPTGAQTGDPFVWYGSKLVPYDASSHTIGNGSGYVKPIIYKVDSDAGTLPNLMQLFDVSTERLALSNTGNLTTQSFLAKGGGFGGSTDTSLVAGTDLTTGTGHNTTIAGGTGQSGGTGADLGGWAWLVGGNHSGGGAAGNALIGGSTASTIPTDFKSMAGGVVILQCDSIPTGNPPVGVYWQYIDPSDHKLKLWGSSGTITILAVP